MTNYCGPGKWSLSTTPELNKICKQHDKDYATIIGMGKDPYFNKNWADRKMLTAMEKIPWYDRDHVWQAAYSFFQTKNLVGRGMIEEKRMVPYTKSYLGKRTHRDELEMLDRQVQQYKRRAVRRNHNANRRKMARRYKKSKRKSYRRKRRTRRSTVGKRKRTYKRRTPRYKTPFSIMQYLNTLFPKKVIRAEGYSAMCNYDTAATPNAIPNKALWACLGYDSNNRYNYFHHGSSRRFQRVANCVNSSTSSASTDNQWTMMWEKSVTTFVLSNPCNYAQIVEVIEVAQVKQHSDTSTPVGVMNTLIGDTEMFPAGVLNINTTPNWTLVRADVSNDDAHFDHANSDLTLKYSDFQPAINDQYRILRKQIKILQPNQKFSVTQESNYGKVTGELWDSEAFPLRTTRFLLYRITTNLENSDRDATQAQLYETGLPIPHIVVKMMAYDVARQSPSTRNYIQRFYIDNSTSGGTSAALPEANYPTAPIANVTVPADIPMQAVEDG